MKDLVGQAEALRGQVRGFEKWNRLAAEQQACIAELSEAAVEGEGD